jgi:hypothetical protein
MIWFHCHYFEIENQPCVVVNGKFARSYPFLARLPDMLSMVFHCRLCLLQVLTSFTVYRNVCLLSSRVELGYVYVCIIMCIYIYIYIHTHIYIDICSIMCIYIYICICLHIYIRLYLCARHPAMFSPIPIDFRGRFAGNDSIFRYSGWWFQCV